MIPYYDRIYSFKNYAEEVETILSIADSPQRILDVGCGTGNHAIHFAKQSDVVGIDVDFESIECARKKTKNNPQFFCIDVSDFTGSFDMAVSMFNVVNYIDGLEKLIEFFSSIRRLTDGLFVFDCWNGIAAILDNPKDKRTVTDKILISIQPETSLINQCVEIKTFVNMDGEDFTYSYKQTLWTPWELRSVLNMAGFETVKISEWMKPDIPATEKSWKIMVMCK